MKEPDCLDAVRQAKQVDRRHDSRLDKSPSVWTLARDVVATVGSTKVASSVSGLKLLYMFRHWGAILREFFRSKKYKPNTLI